MNKKPSAETSTGSSHVTTALNAESNRSSVAVAQGSTPAASSPDVVLVHGMTDDRKGLKVIRARNEGIEAGEMRPLVEGQPITSDVVRLKPRAGSPYICDVETEFSASRVPRSSGSDAEAVRSGPAQVASQAYRTNWDTIWSRSKLDVESDPAKLN